MSFKLLRNYQKPENIKYWQACGGGETGNLMHCWGEYKMVVAAVENSMVVLPKIKNRITL